MAKAAPKTLSDNVQCILGVDRLDYTKGLTNRMLAIERLLEDHPEHLEKIMFMQVSTDLSVWKLRKIYSHHFLIR